MHYTLLHDDNTWDILSRLFKARQIQDDKDSFLNPTYKEYRTSPSQLNDIQKATARIITAMEQNEKIMIFGDYDVDGLMSSYVMYTFFRKHLEYKNISIRLPHRKKDWYGIKSYHIDQIKELWCSLIITVDNGITANEEVEHAKKEWIDLIVTDHHHALDQIPDALAVVNPQISPDCEFKEVCGATVAWKVCLHIADTLAFSKEQKRDILEEFLPFVGIATVADCMPLIKENRLIVKKALELMNTRRSELASSLQWFLDYLDIKEVESYHFGFMIWPRLNASGRIGDATDGLRCLLCHDTSKQIEYLDHLDAQNERRKETQEKMFQTALELTDSEWLIITAAHEDFHAWIVWIVAGKLTEKHYKPSVILEIDQEKWIATWSLRWPDYFNIVQMLQDADKLLERYGWHEQAWWLTVKLDNVEKLFKKFQKYCKKNIGETPIKKTLVDTHLVEEDLSPTLDKELAALGPYGIWHPEPSFLVQGITITNIDIIWKKERKHLKLHATIWWSSFHIMQRWKWDQANSILKNTPLNLIGRIKKDSRNGWWYIDGEVFEREKH